MSTMSTCPMMSYEADLQELSQTAMDFAERVLQAVVTEIGQPVSSEQLDELFELCSQALQYAILLESLTPQALHFVESLRELLRQMTISRELRLPDVHRGRPRLQIMEEQLIFLVESGFRVVSEPDPSCGGGGKGLGTILHSSCPQVRMLT